MPLLLGLFSYFAAGFVAALIYNVVRGRRVIECLHFSFVFGVVVMLVVYVAAIALDIADVTPEPGPA